MATMEELEERIKKLEERILVQGETMNRTWDFAQRAIDTQYEKKRFDYQRLEEDREQKVIIEGNKQKRQSQMTLPIILENKY